MGHPLTVHGKAGHMHGYLDNRDTVSLRLPNHIAPELMLHNIIITRLTEL